MSTTPIYVGVRVNGPLVSRMSKDLPADGIVKLNVCNDINVMLYANGEAYAYGSNSEGNIYTFLIMS